MIWILLIIFIKIYLILKLKNLQYNIEKRDNFETPLLRNNFSNLSVFFLFASRSNDIAWQGTVTRRLIRINADVIALNRDFSFFGCAHGTKDFIPCVMSTLILSLRVICTATKWGKRMKTEKIWREKKRTREKRVIDEQIDRSGIKYEKEA